MFVRAVGVCLVLAVVSAQKQETPLELKALSPGEGDNTGKTLKVVCSFDKAKAQVADVQSFSLYGAPKGKSMTLLYDVTPPSMIKGTKVWAKFEATGSVTKEVNQQSKLEITWDAADDGYNAQYRCSVQGTRENSRRVNLFQLITVQAAPPPPAQSEVDCPVISGGVKQVTGGIETLAENVRRIPYFNRTLAHDAAVLDGMKQKLNSIADRTKEWMDKTTADFDKFYRVLVTKL